MKPKRIILMAISGLMLSTGTALANNPPSGQTFLSLISILPLIIIFSMMGGAYTVLKQLAPNGFGKGFFICGIAVALIFSMMHEGFAVIVAVVFGIYAIVRSLMMLGWGLTALTRREQPAHLTGARPWRLISCSAGLMIITVFLVGLCIVFTGSLVREYKYRNLEEALQNFVSHQIAYAREQKAQTGRSRFDKAARDVYFQAYPHARVKYSPDNKKFTVVVPPESVPVFPYNYMTAIPSYRADETGRIRMIRVRSKSHLCPADAPVIMQIEAQDYPKTQRPS